MFWGIVIKDSEYYNLDFDETKILHISHTSLVKTKEKNRKTYIQISNDNMKSIIGILNQGENDSLELDYFISNDDDGGPYKINLINGEGSEVHLTGYFVPEIIENSLQTQEEYTNCEEFSKKQESCCNFEKENAECIDLQRLNSFLKRKKEHPENFEFRPCLLERMGKTQSKESFGLKEEVSRKKREGKKIKSS